MDSDSALSSFAPLIARASDAFATDFRYAEAMAKHAVGLTQRERTAYERRVLVPAA